MRVSENVRAMPWSHKARHGINTSTECAPRRPEPPESCSSRLGGTTARPRLADTQCAHGRSEPPHRIRGTAIADPTRIGCQELPKPRQAVRAGDLGRSARSPCPSRRPDFGATPACSRGMDQPNTIFWCVEFARAIACEAHRKCTFRPRLLDGRGTAGVMGIAQRDRSPDAQPEPTSYIHDECVGRPTSLDRAGVPIRGP